MIWFQLLYVYLKVGILGFGGGYAMLSLIQADVVDRYHWITITKKEAEKNAKHYIIQFYQT